MTILVILSKLNSNANPSWFPKENATIFTGAEDFSPFKTKKRVIPVVKLL